MKLLVEGGLQTSQEKRGLRFFNDLRVGVYAWTSMAVAPPDKVRQVIGISADPGGKSFGDTKLWI